MNGKKCRLCECLVDKQTGFSCSLNDDGFRRMIKTVFPFPIPVAHKVASKSYNMPVLVCFQCSTSIRNFYNFSKQVELIQTKLKSECMRKDDSLSVDELLLYIKEEPGLQRSATDENTNESLMMSAEIEDSESERQNIPTQKGRSEDNNREPESSGPNDHLVEQNEEEEIIVYVEKSATCVDKTEVIESIAKMERRIHMATEKLNIIMWNMQKPNTGEQTAALDECFDFDLITSKEECTVFNNRLAETDYMDKVLRWLTGNIASHDSMKRLVKAFDLMFSKQFLAVCTWTGERSLDRNVAFQKYKNILTLLKCTATTHLSRIDDRILADFIKRRLKHAKYRAQYMTSR